MKRKKNYRKRGPRRTRSQKKFDGKVRWMMAYQYERLHLTIQKLEIGLADDDWPKMHWFRNMLSKVKLR